MLSVSHLTTKRAILLQQLEQHVGHINRINGAVAQLDELLGEMASEAEQERDEDAADASWLGPETVEPIYCTPDGPEHCAVAPPCSSCPQSMHAVDTAPPLAPAAPSMTPPSPPEMFERASEEEAVEAEDGRYVNSKGERCVLS